MTTNKPGAVTQQPLYGCINCYEDCTWPASDLRFYGGECWCYVCWEEIRGWEFPDKPFWNDLEPYTPALQAPQPAEVGADEREAFETARDAAYRTEPGTFDAWDAWQARAQLTEGAVTDDMRQAVRWAPSSAYWSQRLFEFFGPDARDGIAALEKQLREAQAALTAAGRWEELERALTDLCDEIDAHTIHTSISATNITWFKRKAREALAASKPAQESSK